MVELERRLVRGSQYGGVSRRGLKLVVLKLVLLSSAAMEVCDRSHARMKRHDGQSRRLDRHSHLARPRLDRSVR